MQLWALDGSLSLLPIYSLLGGVDSQPPPIHLFCHYTLEATLLIPKLPPVLYPWRRAFRP